jgi:hypothetical protein
MRLSMNFSLLLMTGLFSTGLIGAQTTVFLNELHYDNAGSDVGEGFEVAGPAGTDLTGWKVFFYNGNGGLAYDSVSLSGTLPGQMNGFGAAWWDAPGSMQNGPDGLALTDAAGRVVQFLTYEGSFMAVDGPASGMTGKDMGVEEGGTTATGQSLQLSGDGTVYEDFDWLADQPATPGSVNEGQAFGSAAPADTVPPSFTEGYPRAVNVTAGRFDILLNLSEACTVYYLARMGQVQAPDSLAVQCGDTLMIGRAATDYIIPVDTASPSSNYEIYFLAADLASPPNIMDTAVMLRVRTLDDDNLRLIRPLAGDTVYAGDSLVVSWTSAEIDSILVSMFDFRDDDWAMISGGGIPATDSTWGYRIPVDVGIDSMMLRIASSRDQGLYAESGVIRLRDTLDPEIIRLTPPNHATGVPLSPALEMVFNERVYPGAGYISLHGEYGGQIEIHEVNGEQIGFDAEAYAVQLTLSSPLPLSGRYHVRVEPGAIIDYQGNAFRGFSSDTGWAFTTTQVTGHHLACWEDPANGRIRIYPNPAREEITMEWYGIGPARVEVEIIGMNGVTAYRNTYPSVIRLQEKIGLKDMAAGLYMLRLRAGNNLSVSWLVVQ